MDKKVVQQGLNDLKSHVTVIKQTAVALKAAADNQIEAAKKEVHDKVNAAVDACKSKLDPSVHPVLEDIKKVDTDVSLEKCKAPSAPVESACDNAAQKVTTTAAAASNSLSDYLPLVIGVVAIAAALVGHFQFNLF